MVRKVHASEGPGAEIVAAVGCGGRVSGLEERKALGEAREGKVFLLLGGWKPTRFVGLLVPRGVAGDVLRLLLLLLLAAVEHLLEELELGICES